MLLILAREDKLCSTFQQQLNMCDMKRFENLRLILVESMSHKVKSTSFARTPSVFAVFSANQNLVLLDDILENHVTDFLRFHLVKDQNNCIREKGVTTAPYGRGWGESRKLLIQHWYSIGIIPSVTSLCFYISLCTLF